MATIEETRRMEQEALRRSGGVRGVHRLPEFKERALSAFTGKPFSAAAAQPTVLGGAPVVAPTAAGPVLGLPKTAPDAAPSVDPGLNDVTVPQERGRAAAVLETEQRGDTADLGGPPPGSVGKPVNYNAPPPAFDTRSIGNNFANPTIQGRRGVPLQQDPGTGGLGARSGGVTFRTPVTAGYGPGQSPILQEAANKDARAAAERAATRDELVNSLLQRALGASGSQTPGDYRAALAGGALASRVLGADPSARAASAERIAAGGEATARRGQDVTARGQDISSATTRRGQDVTARGQDISAEASRYGADVGLEGTRAKAIADAAIRGEGYRSSERVARIGAEGRRQPPKVTYDPVTGEKSISSVEGGVQSQQQYDRSQARVQIERAFEGEPVGTIKDVNGVRIRKTESGYEQVK